MSSVIVLMHSYKFISSKESNDLLVHCKLGERTREKLSRVAKWVRRTESAFQLVQQVEPHQKSLKNWKANDEMKLNCLSVSEILCLTGSCSAKFYAYIGEIIFPFTLTTDEVENEDLFVSKRSFRMVDDKIAEDLISTGCNLCGSSFSRHLLEQKKCPLYCPKSSNHVHNICLIYRPFMLYVWDQTGQVPLLVKNRAAEILFGNITAENVQKCYNEGNKIHAPLLSSSHPKGSSIMTNRKQKKNTIKNGVNQDPKNHNLYRIWLILLKVILQHGKNSPFVFEIAVNKEKDSENGRFELLSFTMPC